jgi:hypothetical protein
LADSAEKVKIKKAKRRFWIEGRTGRDKQCEILPVRSVQVLDFRLPSAGPLFEIKQIDLTVSPWLLMRAETAIKRA